MSKKIHLRPFFIFTLIFCLCAGVFFVLLKKYGYTGLFVNKVIAIETECSDDMTDEQCLNFLKQQSEQLKNQQSQLQTSLTEEQRKKMTLNEQLNYINSQISARESRISEMEIQIQTNNVEIKILGRDIEAIQENISTLSQETTELQQKIGKKIMVSYKYSNLTAVELLLSSDDFETLMKKTKYLTEARKRDRELLEDINQKIAELTAQEKELSDKKLEVQTKRNQIETEKTSIYAEKASLAQDKSVQEQIMAEVNARLAEYNAQLAQLKAAQAQIDAQSAELIMKMYQQGQLGNGTQVKAGQIIGFQGHTGCAYGSHLHYGIVSKASSKWWSTDINPFNYLGLSGNYVVNGSAVAPLDGGYLTQSFHQGYSIDIVSLTAGNQLQSVYGACYVSPSTNQCYYVTRGSITCPYFNTFEGWLPLQGEGAPVYSLKEGKVYYGTEGWGAKFALVEHPDGIISVYVHLR